MRRLLHILLLAAITAGAQDSVEPAYVIRSDIQRPAEQFTIERKWLGNNFMVAWDCYDGTNTYANLSDWSITAFYSRDQYSTAGVHIAASSVSNNRAYFIGATNFFDTAYDNYWVTIRGVKSGKKFTFGTGRMIVDFDPFETAGGSAPVERSTWDWDLIGTYEGTWPIYAGSNVTVQTTTTGVVIHAAIPGGAATNGAWNASVAGASNLAFAVGAGATNLWNTGTGALWSAINSKGTGSVGSIAGLATGTPVYAESDPVWVGASNLYYTKVLADAKFATGTPVYVESDPRWAAVSNLFRIGTNVLADQGNTNLLYNGVPLRDGVGSGGASSPTGTISVNHLVVTSTNQTTPADASQIELLEGNGQIAGRIFYQRDVADSNHYFLGFTHNASLTNGTWAVDNNALPASRLGLENHYNNGSRRAHEFNWDVDNAGGSGAEFRRIFNIYAYSDGSNNDAAATFFVPRFWFQSNSGGLTSLIVSSASDPSLYGAGWPYIRTAQDLGGLHKYGMVIGAGYGHLYLQHDVGNTNHVFMAVPDANRVGIGTTNATSKLTVAGDVSADRLYVSSIVSTNNQFSNTNDLPSEFSWIGGNRNRFLSSFFQPGFTNGFGFLGGGGYSNAWLMSTAQGTMIAGGVSNFALQDISGAALVGGIGNSINNAKHAGWLGGRSCTVNGEASASLGGQGNTISGGWTICGGRENIAAANYGAIAGYQNQIQAGALWAAIVGGRTNIIEGASYGSIGGGGWNTIGAAGLYGTIPGGTSNRVLGIGGFAAGNAAVVSATATGSFFYSAGQLPVTNSVPRSAAFNVPGGFMISGGGSYGADSQQGISVTNLLLRSDGVSVYTQIVVRGIIIQ